MFALFLRLNSLYSMHEVYHARNLLPVFRMNCSVNFKGILLELSVPTSQLVLEA